MCRSNSTILFATAQQQIVEVGQLQSTTINSIILFAAAQQGVEVGQLAGTSVIPQFSLPLHNSSNYNEVWRY